MMQDKHTTAAADAGLTLIAAGREAEIYAWGEGSVLRLFREQRPPLAIEREAAAMRAVRASFPLVPEVRGEASALGRPGLILERVDGIDLLTRIDKKPWTIWNAGAISGGLHAQVHDIEAPAVMPSLRDRINGSLAQPLVPPHLAEYARRELESLPDGDRLCHGDFHPGNILLSSHGPIVIDWPNAARGDPTADLARTIMMIEAAALPQGTALVVRVGQRFGRRVLLAAYMRAYRRHRPVDAALLQRWITVRRIDRLAEDIPEERATLLAAAERSLARAIAARS